MQIEGTVSLYCCCEWFCVYRNNCCVGQAGCPRHLLCLNGAEVASAHPRTDVAVGMSLGEPRSCWCLKYNTKHRRLLYKKSSRDKNPSVPVTRSNRWVRKAPCLLEAWEGNERAEHKHDFVVAVLPLTRGSDQSPTTAFCFQTTCRLLCTNAVKSKGLKERKESPRLQKDLKF